jgi:hypothetical protein
LLDRVEEATYSKYRPTVKQVWGLIRPVVVEELKNRSEPDIVFPQEVLPPIVEWLKTNAPPNLPNLRISPAMPPVTTTQVTKVDANGHK